MSMIKTATDGTAQLTAAGKGAAVGTGSWGLGALWAWFGDNHYELAGFGILAGLALHAFSVYIQWKRNK